MCDPPLNVNFDVTDVTAPGWQAQMEQMIRAMEQMIRALEYIHRTYGTAEWNPRRAMELADPPFHAIAACSDGSFVRLHF